eukprot:2294116-Rhodomonas_salina.3
MLQLDAVCAIPTTLLPPPFPLSIQLYISGTNTWYTRPPKVLKTHTIHELYFCLWTVTLAGVSQPDLNLKQNFKLIVTCGSSLTGRCEKGGPGPPPQSGEAASDQGPLDPRFTGRLGPASDRDRAPPAGPHDMTRTP